MIWKYPVAALLVTFTLGIFLACQGQSAPTPPVQYSAPQLEYRLLSQFDDVFWCDPDFYPVERPGQEQKNALEQFPVIKANEAEFSAILEHLGLPDKADYTDSEKLQIYREHKKLEFAVHLTASGQVYDFTLRVGEVQGERIEGTITKSGKITVLRREPSSNTCPICLTQGTIIDTPGGPVPVQDLHSGMAVWTLDGSGKRVAAVVLRTTTTPVPSSFRVVRIRLDDGRTVTASADHPTAEGRTLGDYRVGDLLDGGLVIEAELVPYESGATYDLLPSGATGFYWANGVLLGSTLAGTAGPGG